jgi:uncharacterized protein
MTLYVDTTALLARHLDVPERAVAVDAMAADPQWCTSALAVTECLALVERVSDDEAARDRLRQAIRDDADRMAIVPVDQMCLDRAAELCRTQPLAMVHALHLAAAARLPAPTTYLTFEADQLLVAASLGYDVASL